MRSTQNGVEFVIKHPSLPQNTFVSNDAVTWLMNNVNNFDGRSEAIERLEVDA